MIKKINKRFIASGAFLTLLPSVLTGCSTSSNKQDITYSKVEDIDRSEYDFLKNCYYIEIENNNDEKEYYIANRYKYYEGGINGYKYHDLLSDKDVYIRKQNSYDYFYWTPNGSNRKFIKEIRLEDYLYSLNMVKFNYTDEDIKYLLEEMKNIDEVKLVKE